MRECNSILIAIFLLGEVIDCLIKLGHALDLTSYQKRKGSEIISDQLEEHLKPNDSNQMLFCETTGPSSSQRKRIGSRCELIRSCHFTDQSYLTRNLGLIYSSRTIRMAQSVLCLLRWTLQPQRALTNGNKARSAYSILQPI